MKITMLRNPAKSLGYELTEGQTADVPDGVGQSLIAIGIAIGIPDEIKAVPETTAVIGVPEADQISATEEPAQPTEQPRRRK